VAKTPVYLLGPARFAPVAGAPVTEDTDVDDSSGTGRWLTYDELAALRGIKRIGAVRLVQRHKWRRQAGNDGLARVLVPPDALEPVRRTAAGTSAPANGASTNSDDSPHTIAGIDAPDIVVQLVAQLDQANQRADEANRRADVAVAVADRTLAQLAEAHTEAGKLRDRLDIAEHQATDAKRQAAQLRQAVQKADHDRTAAVAIADEAVRAAEELRQAEADRRGQGRWARLRAAWRRE
jgi:hypothetical protein